MKVPRSGRPHHIGVYYGAKAADCRAVWRRALITGDLRFGAKQTLGFILIVLFPSNIKAGVCRFPASLRKAFFSSLMIISAVEGQLRGRLCDYAERDAKMGTGCTVPLCASCDSHSRNFALNRPELSEAIPPQI